jgi:GDPmannose 4,6-dehydratase
VTGANGQDGQHLTRLLLEQGVHVCAAVREGDLRRPFAAHSTQINTVTLSSVAAHLDRQIQEIAPDQVYCLAAAHASSQASSGAGPTWDALFGVNVIAPALLLDSLSRQFPACAVFTAGTCHLFGEPVDFPQSEITPFHPTTPYALSKQSLWQVIRHYRRQSELKISFGILFNHESPLRGPSFLSTRIARAAALVHLGRGEILKIGSLSAQVDWGYAPDFCEAMIKCVQAQRNEDYVIASGIAHSVQDFVTVAFDQVGQDPRQWIQEDSKAYLPKSKAPYVGDTRKIQKELGWQPKTTFEEMVRGMVQNQIERLSCET